MLCTWSRFFVVLVSSLTLAIQAIAAPAQDPIGPWGFPVSNEFVAKLLDVSTVNDAEPALSQAPTTNLSLPSDQLPFSCLPHHGSIAPADIPIDDSDIEIELMPMAPLEMPIELDSEAVKSPPKQSLNCPFECELASTAEQPSGQIQSLEEYDIFVEKLIKKVLFSKEAADLPVLSITNAIVGRQVSPPENHPVADENNVVEPPIANYDVAPPEPVQQVFPWQLAIQPAEQVSEPAPQQPETENLNFWQLAQKPSKQISVPAPQQQQPEIHNLKNAFKTAASQKRLLDSEQQTAQKAIGLPSVSINTGNHNGSIKQFNFVIQINRINNAPSTPQDIPPSMPITDSIAGSGELQQNDFSSNAIAKSRIPARLASNTQLVVLPGVESVPARKPVELTWNDIQQIPGYVSSLMHNVRQSQLFTAPELWWIEIQMEIECQLCGSPWLAVWHGMIDAYADGKRQLKYEEKRRLERLHAERLRFVAAGIDQVIGFLDTTSRNLTHLALEKEATAANPYDSKNKR